MIRNGDYSVIIEEQNKILAKFRPFKSAYEMKEEIERLNKRIEDLNIINEEHRILNGELRRELEVEKDISDGMLKTIDKSIEHLVERNKQDRSALTNREDTIISKHELLRLEIVNNNLLLEILKGSDNK